MATCPVSQTSAHAYVCHGAKETSTYRSSVLALRLPNILPVLTQIPVDQERVAIQVNEDVVRADVTVQNSGSSPRLLVRCTRNRVRNVIQPDM